MLPLMANCKQSIVLSNIEGTRFKDKLVWTRFVTKCFGIYAECVFVRT